MGTLNHLLIKQTKNPAPLKGEPDFVIFSSFVSGGSTA